MEFVSREDMNKRFGDIETQSNSFISTNTAIQSNSLVVQKKPKGNSVFPGPNFGPCKFDKRHTPINLAGNIFVLGLIVLINEILDLTAAQSLQFLLQPCVSANNDNEDVLAAEVAVDEVGI